MKTIALDARSLVVADPLMEQALKIAAAAAGSLAPVLISGPSGTGKELVARYIHHCSRRQSFVSINCAAIPDGLVEAELFGHEKGSFTGATSQRVGKFERASLGTLLLDEVSEMPLHLQSKLLRVLQEGELDRIGGNESIPITARVISTTNRDPSQIVREGAFRSDLYYRLNVIRIDLAPLAGRSKAIVDLAGTFARQSPYSNRRGNLSLTEAAEKRLMDHSWPGNVRELQNVIERASLSCNGVQIDVDDIFLDPVWGDIEKPVLLSQVEQEHILSTLKNSAGNRSEAARRLGISVRTLRNKLKDYGHAA